MQSLSRKFLIAVGASTIVLTLLASACSFLIFQRELVARQIQYLQSYVGERTNNVDRRFSALSGVHAGAAQLLAKRMARMSPERARWLLDHHFPLAADGTRRSRPEDFDGVESADGSLTYGMGAFIARGRDIPAHEEAALAAAFDVVSRVGQAVHAGYDNFYFFTPGTRVVMFGPDRPDRLMFYRRDAPATLDTSREEMARLVLPSVNPQGQTRCTTLQRLVQDKSGQRVGTACVTPVRIGGRFVGAFGSSLQLTGFFLNAVADTLPGASAVVVTQKGDLIAYPGFARGGKTSPEKLAALERRMQLAALVARVEKQGAAQGVVSSPDGKQLVAYGRLKGPDWYLLLSYPKSAVTWSAARSASWILLAGLLAAVAQMLVVVRLAQQTMVAPLQALAASCTPGLSHGDGAAPLARRPDEIGLLARSLAAERGRADELLASLETRVAQRTRELERANEEKSRFLANMSHELRTPLNGVIAVSETLASRQTTGRDRELADLIVSSGRLLEQVLTDILDFSKIEAGEVRMEQAPFDLGLLMQRIAAVHRVAAESKGLALRVEIDPVASATYLGDAVRLTQVLSNLLSNAVKFTAAGEVSLQAQVGEDGMLLLRVSDTGIGFDEETGLRLFQRFQQADDSIRRRFGGTGLGLAISRSLVELMGGALNAASRPGAGSIFEILLPAQRVEATQASDAGAVEADRTLSGRRVLLAEDHPTNQRVVQIILESADIDLTIVGDGALALERIAEEDFDLVLMDMQMPELDGLSAVQELRRREQAAGTPRLPVVMLTANAMDEHVRASLQAGADRHLSKPLRPTELLQTIAELLASGPTSHDAPLIQAA